MRGITIGVWLLCLWMLGGQNRTEPAITNFGTKAVTGHYMFLGFSPRLGWRNRRYLKGIKVFQGTFPACPLLILQSAINPFNPEF